MYIKYPEYLDLAPFMYCPSSRSPSRRLHLGVPLPYSGASTPEGARTPTDTGDLKADLGNLLTSSVLSSFSFSRQNSETRYGLKEITRCERRHIKAFPRFGVIAPVNQTSDYHPNDNSPIVSYLNYVRTYVVGMGRRA